MTNRVIDWTAIRFAYEGSTESIRKIAEEHGVSHQAIRNKAKAERWLNPRDHLDRNVLEAARQRRYAITRAATKAAANGGNGHGHANGNGNGANGHGDDDDGAVGTRQTDEPASDTDQEQDAAPGAAESFEEGDGLTDKRRRFVAEYMLDLDAAKAARRAGYSKNGSNHMGYLLLQDPKVRAALKLEMDARSHRTKITADRVLQELAKLAFADVRNAVEWDGVLVKLRPSAELDEITAAAIVEVKQTREGVSIKMADKRASLVDVGKHLGMFQPASAGKDGAVAKRPKDMTDEEIIRMFPDLAAKLGFSGPVAGNA